MPTRLKPGATPRLTRSTPPRPHPLPRGPRPRNLGAYHLGQAFFKGTSGLPKEPARARYWLKKVVDGECKIKHLSDSAKARVAEWLRELDG